MFVCTLKWNKKLVLLVIIAVALILCALIIFSGSGGGAGGEQKVKNNEQRIEFLESLGWKVSSDAICEKSIIIPKEFSLVYKAYNELQKAQGYDLSKYCGMEAVVYTYSIENYSGYTGRVVADLYVLNGTVIGGDVHSLALDGFMHGLKKN